MWRTSSALLLVLCSAAVGADSSYDRIWSHANLYQNDQSYLSSLVLSGRAQGDWVYVDDGNDSHDDLLWRRFRAGAVARFSPGWMAHAEAEFDFNESLGSSYTRLTDAYVGWDFGEGWSSKLGKHSAPFTLDGGTSSKKLITPERNNLSNNLWFPAEYFTGWSVQGDCGSGRRCGLNLYSSDGADEISGFDASWFVLANVQWDLDGAWGSDELKLSLDYVHNDEDAEANTRPLTDVLSLVLKSQRGDWHFDAELAGALGFDEEADLAGLVLMPYYDLDSRWQLVGRYTGLVSSKNQGIRVNRYEQEVISGDADEYQELFLGLNLFLYGHRLKWQLGGQYVWAQDDDGDDGDHEGWAVTGALRLYW